MSRPTQALVDLACIRSNLAAIRRHIGPGPGLMVPVKADAYGHGAVPVARICESAGVSFLAVASVDEGRELREAGIRLPVIILGNILPSETAEAAAHDLTVSICDEPVAEALAAAARQRQTQASVFVNVDTGMGRVGIHPWTEAASRIAAVARRPELSLRGVFSHLSSAGDPDRSFTHEQIRRFSRVRSLVEEAGIAVPYWSLANSTAVCDLPEAHFDLVRPGIMVYGFCPSSNGDLIVPLRPAMTFRTQVVFAKRVGAGTPIGYGRTYTVPLDDSLLVTLPVGYADGYSRALSNRAHVLINEQRYRVSGRVSMDQVIVDLGPAGTAVVGDEVVLFGGQGRNTIPATEIAALLDTIVYEVTCAVSKRVPRIWVDTDSENSEAL